jgi:hypothetical protein
MPRNISLADLVPEHDTFTDTDGKRYEFHSRDEFGAIDLARVSRMQKGVQAAMDALGEDTGDMDAAAQMEQAMADMLALLLPDVPKERWAGVALGLKMRLLEFWSAANNVPAEADAGEAKADEI